MEHRIACNGMETIEHVKKFVLLRSMIGNEKHEVYKLGHEKRLSCFVKSYIQVTFLFYIENLQDIH